MLSKRFILCSLGFVCLFKAVPGQYNELEIVDLLLATTTKSESVDKVFPSVAMLKTLQKTSATSSTTTTTIGSVTDAAGSENATTIPASTIDPTTSRVTNLPSTFTNKVTNPTETIDQASTSPPVINVPMKVNATLKTRGPSIIINIIQSKEKHLLKVKPTTTMTTTTTPPSTSTTSEAVKTESTTSPSPFQTVELIASTSEKSTSTLKTTESALVTESETLPTKKKQKKTTHSWWSVQPDIAEIYHRIFDIRRKSDRHDRPVAAGYY